MRRQMTRLAVLVVACGPMAIGAQSLLAATGQGRLAGLTQITYGCPGPQRIGEQCQHWSTFMHARFAVTRDRANGTPIASTRRIVASDQHGGFNVQLTTGTYTLTPLPQAHTRGGTTLTVFIHAGIVTRVTVRFLGYPMMA
jgi:hypothetical protein